MGAERHAVVIGASMAGLVTAKVLADRVSDVTVIDRDALPAGPVARKGVPQSRHAHGLLPSGERILRELFRDLIDDLIVGGAQPVSADTWRWWQGGGYRIDAPGAAGVTFLSRPFLEHRVRERVQALANVVFVQAPVRGLDSDGNRVVGVAIGGDGGRLEHVRADLVVDASGRGSQASRWLAEMGYDAPPVSEVRIDIAYASRLYRRTPGRLPDRTWMTTIDDPSRSERFGVAFPIEGDRWIVTLAGCHGDRPPTDDEGHLAFAKRLPTPDIADILEHEQPAGPIVSHRFPSNHWRHFEKLRRHPAGFVALGDAICSLNPIYGQGMSSAAEQATALAGCIDESGVDAPTLWRSFYRQARRVIANPWVIAAGGDFVFPETTGPKPPGTNAINRYIRKVVIASQHDSDVAAALWHVQGLLAPPPSLMKPALLIRVLRTARRGPTGHPATAALAAA